MRSSSAAARCRTPSWRVLGYDRFAREEYLIGEFPSRALAEAAAREAERRHELTQDAPLRDDVWIVAPSPRPITRRTSGAAPAVCWGALSLRRLPPFVTRETRFMSSSCRRRSPAEHDG
jgi:hypothetical protein